MDNIDKPLSWTSYPSIYNLGHSAIKDLLNGPVLVEEKVDGSQFSMCRTEQGELLVRSKGAIMYSEAPEKMFTKAVEAAKLLDLHPGWTYRCEYLAKPKHNTLAYDRVPNHHLILFDVGVGLEEYLDVDSKRIEGDRLGLETVPCLLYGPVENVTVLRNVLDNNISVLGAQKIEGIVIKPVKYNIFGIDKKVLMGKFVSEAFKEVHHKAWRENNPSSKDIIERLAVEYCTPARWGKAVEHLRDSGGITDSPKDIGLLIKEVQVDVLKECEDEIKERVWKWAWPHIQRGLTRGLPEWYKGELMKRQFEEPLGNE